MNERIKELRKVLNLSQEEFGQRLGVTKTAICSIESGRRNLTSQMETSICREYNVNSEWLRTGSGEMFVELSRAEMAARIVGNTLTTDDEFILNAFITLGQLSPDEWALIKKIVDKLKK